MMKKILIVGGSNGIGLSMAHELSKLDSTESIYIVDKVPFPNEYWNSKIKSCEFDLTNSDYSIFDKFCDIDGLMITAGFGRLALFEDIPEDMIPLYFNVNTIAIIRVIKHFYDKLLGGNDFYCGVMVSIAGFMSSPFFSLYGATKAALKIFIESVNVELEKSGSKNRILNVSPGSIKGTSFNNEKTDLSKTTPLAIEILSHLMNKDDLFIPEYDTVFKNVLSRYYEDFRAEGLHSYEYKLQNRRIADTKGLILK